MFGGEAATVAAPGGLEHALILGLAIVRPRYAYHPAQQLTHAEQDQVHFWRCLGLQRKHLWFFKSEFVSPFGQAVARGDFITATRSSKIYRVVDDTDSREQLKQLATRALPADMLLQALQDYCLCFTLPYAFAHLLIQGRWDSFAVPSPYSPHPFKAPPGVRDGFNDGVHDAVTEFFRQSVETLPQHLGWYSEERFASRSMTPLAAELRRVALASPQHSASLSVWIARLENAADDINVLTTAARRPMEDLIQYMLLSDMLKSSANLHEVIERSVRIALPPSIGTEVLEAFAAKKLQVPDKGQVSRARMTLDCVLMMWLRCRHHDQGTYARYIGWDSSPQYGRDYVLAYCRSIKCEDLPQMLLDAHSLNRMWHVDGEPVPHNHEVYDDERRAKREKQLMARIQAGIEVHTLPAVCVGFGSCSFAHKFRALCHAGRLEHFTDESFVKWVGEIATGMGDYGVERLLSKVKPHRISEILPYFQFTADQDIHAVMEHVLQEDSSQPNPEQQNMVFEEDAVVELMADDEAMGEARPPSEVFEEHVPDDAGAEWSGRQEVPDAVFQEAPPEAMVDYSEMLDAPALHHIIDNAAEGLDAVMGSFKDNVHSASMLCKIIRRRGHRTKLLERCFNSELGQQYHSYLKNFKGHIFRGRWGTISFGVGELVKVEWIMRWGWGRERFLGDDGDQQKASLSRWLRPLSMSGVWHRGRVLELVVASLFSRHDFHMVSIRYSGC